MSDKTVKFKVWDYIRIVKCANIHEIASTLRMAEREVLDIVEDLQKDNYLERIPVPLDKSRDSSCYYVATGKEFIC